MWVSRVFTALIWLSIQLLVRGAADQSSNANFCNNIDLVPLRWPSDTSEISSLEIAANCNRLDLIRQYLEESDYPISNQNEQRSLQLAIFYGFQEIVDYFLYDRNIPINDDDEDDEWFHPGTLINTAVLYGNVSMIKKINKASVREGFDHTFITNTGVFAVAKHFISEMSDDELEAWLFYFRNRPTAKYFSIVLVRANNANAFMLVPSLCRGKSRALPSALVQTLPVDETTGYTMMSIQSYPRKSFPQGTLCEIIFIYTPATSAIASEDNDGNSTCTPHSFSIAGYQNCSSMFVELTPQSQGNERYVVSSDGTFLGANNVVAK